MKTLNHRLKTLLLLVSLPVLVATSCTVAAPTQGPPPARVEVIPVAPSPRHVWIPGHYVRRGRNYGWINGFYRVAPARYVAWVPGHWQQSRRGPVWIEGHWR